MKKPWPVQMKETMKEVIDPYKSYKNAAHAAWQFAYEMKAAHKSAAENYQRNFEYTAAALKKGWKISPKFIADERTTTLY